MFGTVAREVRRCHGITMKELAKRAGYPYGVVRRIESGIRKLKNDHEMERYVSAMNPTSDEESYLRLAYQADHLAVNPRLSYRHLRLLVDLNKSPEKLNEAVLTVLEGYLSQASN